MRLYTANDKMRILIREKGEKVTQFLSSGAIKTFLASLSTRGSLTLTSSFANICGTRFRHYRGGKRLGQVEGLFASV